MTCYKKISSPVGELQLFSQGEYITGIRFCRAGQGNESRSDWEIGASVLDELTGQLESYFAGKLRKFDLPLRPAGTPFQTTVWEALRVIPYGETISYGELAALIGRPAASRAVGAANGQNPIPIVIPCHRVIGSDGSLTGYGGGLDIKKALLQIEGWRPSAQLSLARLQI